GIAGAAVQSEIIAIDDRDLPVSVGGGIAQHAGESDCLPGLESVPCRGDLDRRSVAGRGDGESRGADANPDFIISRLREAVIGFKDTGAETLPGSQFACGTKPAASWCGY